MSIPLSGCTYFVQNEAGEFVTGEHVFEDDGKCYNCGAKNRINEEIKKQLPVEVIEQGVTASV